MEPRRLSMLSPSMRPGETLLVVDSDQRGLGLLKHVREQLCAGSEETKSGASFESLDVRPTRVVSAPEPSDVPFDPSKWAPTP